MIIGVRPATESDCEQLFDWVNDTEVRNASFHTEKIDWLEHQSWYLQKLRNPNSFIFIFEVDRDPAGQIRFDRKDGFFEIDYSIDKKYRGKGYGKIIVISGISKLKSQLKEPLKFLAKVKEGNLISAHVFQKIGFKKNNLSNGNFEFIYE
ncbi:acetyltransferase (GNAT) domain protein [Leptospira yanagawae serovar Saopaulo str. Sao Paulo = ATCC 700523]|uniref:Acetyltransferase (GNAT) domain protein n=1 Tax=Leptospira yanagawae serovar Saopaulo str. Sao Paulo = ATCC 700523 TaxID=1249483 RepID=A0A5E8HAV8_9LEPT|nr:GNAT family N-acetyltransferase [Leptospira yanagawae]EOQ88349.1 acetyltransferase (GNAT) domain protein [Leptospira yanagawae serovar Saopaulo str. Sao Paulo = ATCC 700523]